MQESGDHCIKARFQGGGKEMILLIPAAAARKPEKLADFIARRCGQVLDKKDPCLESFPEAMQSVQTLIGTSRLGWTPERDAFVYEGTIFYTSERPQVEYEFVAQDGMLVKRAEDALSGRGSRQAQYQSFKKLWRGEIFRLGLSLATMSPFLEVIGAAPITFHLAGESGLGKTTRLRLVTSAYGDPDSPLTKVDFSKDTANYADAQLGLLHNFPILLDETTLRDPLQLLEAAYNIAVGRTKGRLTGADQQYLPADTQQYTLVCFLSGERSIRTEMDKRGGAARFMEIVVDEPLLPKGELPQWYAAAGRDWGWFGRDLIRLVLGVYFKKDHAGRGLQALYGTAREGVTRFCEDHPRLVDVLAVVTTGHFLADAVLHERLGRMSAEEEEASLSEAVTFAQKIYGRLNKRMKLDVVLDAIAALPGIGEWVERGFIPTDVCEHMAREEGFRDKAGLGRFLRDQGVSIKTEARKLGDVYLSSRCYILTVQGQQWLKERSKTPAELHSAETDKSK
jgi:hypothetical protein